MSPTQLTPWRQRNGRSFIQKQPDLEEPPAVLEQTCQVENWTCDATPPDDPGSLDVAGSPNQAEDDAVSRRIDRTGLPYGRLGHELYERVGVIHDMPRTTAHEDFRENWLLRKQASWRNWRTSSAEPMEKR